jgi:hypothetical protein
MSERVGEVNQLGGGPMSHVITRRHFVAGTTLGTLGLILRGSSPAWAAAKSKTRVVIVRDPAVLTESLEVNPHVLQGMLDTGMQALTGMKKTEDCWKTFFTPEDVLGIKISVMMTPTHSELTSAVASRLKGMGVKDENILIWDRGDGGIGEKGVLDRSVHFGFNEDSISTVAADRATALINMPGLKSHWLSGIAVAIKNWAGAVTGINVSDDGATFPFHGDSCADVGMLNSLPPIKSKCRLIIVDALRPLFNGGPQVNPKYLWNYGGLVLGTDPVAVDTVCLKIIQGKRNEYSGKVWPISPPPKHIAVADKKYGLGTSEASQIEVKLLGDEEGAFI